MLQPRRTKNSLLLAVLRLGVCSQHRAEVVIFYLLLVRHHEIPPSLLALLALHFVLVNGYFRVELRKVPLEMFVDFIVNLGQT